MKTPCITMLLFPITILLLLPITMLPLLLLSNSFYFFDRTLVEE